MICRQCPRNCGVDREKELGFCKEGEKIRIAKIIDNFMWEEPPVSGKNGTCVIFFSGCNLRCSYCQNYKISRGGVGKESSAEEFAKLLEKIDSSSNESIDLVTPTHFSNQLISAFKIYKPKKKVIYNTSGYESLETIKEISSFVDIFLTDFKYFDENLAKRFSFACDYREKAVTAIKAMHKYRPNIFINEILDKGVIIRHLVLPGQTKDSIDILRLIKKEIDDPVISLMSQFVPSGEEGIGRRLYALEYKIVLKEAKKIGLKKGFFQDLSSSSEKFIPHF